MMDDQKYDAILPERLGDAGWEGDAPCPECGGSGWVYDDFACTAEDCPDCSQSGCRACHHAGEVGGRGTLRVLLTEDPTPIPPDHVQRDMLLYGEGWCASAAVRWRHRGTINDG